MQKCDCVCVPVIPAHSDTGKEEANQKERSSLAAPTKKLFNRASKMIGSTNETTKPPETTDTQSIPKESARSHKKGRLKSHSCPLRPTSHKCPASTRLRPSAAGVSSIRSLVIIGLNVVILQCILIAHTVSGAQTQPSASSSQTTATSLSADVSSNEIQGGRERQRGVTNLKLVPDFRAVKLHWSYEHKHNLSSETPAAFSIRYCELTSWNIEIKCRERELQVSSAASLLEPSAPVAANAANAIANQPTTLRKQQRNPALDSAASLANSNSDSKLLDSNTASQTQTTDTDKSLVTSNYEAFIHDLRALTNYTFRVRVARFASDNPIAQANNVGANEAAANASPSTAATKTTSTQQNAPPPPPPQTSSSDTMGRSRRLLHAEPLSSHSLSGPSGGKAVVAETRAFGAEPSKCAANFSDVLVHTGRYFGGRISVEWPNGRSPAPNACQLSGNRTSERSVYLFRIDHALCGSKTINSFTLKASVSLPRVNNQLAPVPAAASRAAVITQLAARPPTQSSASAQHMLGSMPGVYRPRTGSSSNLNSTNTVDRSQRARALTAGTLQSGVAGNGSPEQSQLQPQLSGASTLAPVAVQSGTLTFAPDEFISGAVVATVDDSSTEQTKRAPKLLLDLQAQPEVLSAAPSEPIITLTNNHRVEGAAAAAMWPRQAHPFDVTSDGGNNLQVAPPDKSSRAHSPPTVAPAGGSSVDEPDFSIRYSTANVDEYAVGRAPSVAPSATTTARSSKQRPSLLRNSPPGDASGPSNSRNSRSGRMQWSQASQVPPLAGAETPAQANSMDNAFQRRTATQLFGSGSNSLAGKSEQLSEPTPQDASPASNATTSLAHNITGYLLKLSLRALSNFARKSLESLAVESANANSTTDELADSISGETIDTVAHRSIELDASSTTNDLGPGRLGARSSGRSEEQSHTSVRPQLPVANRPIAEPTVRARNQRQQDLAEQASDTTHMATGEISERDTSSVHLGLGWPLVGIPLMFIVLVAALVLLKLSWTQASALNDLTGSGAPAADALKRSAADAFRGRTKPNSTGASGSLATNSPTTAPKGSGNQSPGQAPVFVAKPRSHLSGGSNDHLSLLSHSADPLCNSGHKDTFRSTASSTIRSERMCKNSELVLISRPADELRFGSESFA